MKTDEKGNKITFIFLSLDQYSQDLDFHFWSILNFKKASFKTVSFLAIFCIVNCKKDCSPFSNKSNSIGIYQLFGKKVIPMIGSDRIL